MIAAKTTLPVLSVPVTSKHLQGLDSLLSIVQMPKGVPVATFAIGQAGAANAGLFAVALLSIGNPVLAARLESFRVAQAEAVSAMTLPAYEPYSTRCNARLLGGGQLGGCSPWRPRAGYRVTVLILPRVPQAVCGPKASLRRLPGCETL